MNTTTPTTPTTVDNGVNVAALLGARQALSEAPPAASAFQWQARNEWVTGTHSRTTISKFFALGEEQSHTQSFELDTDHPTLFDADDNGVTPVEMVLAGLAGCLSAGIASIAQNRGIQLHSVAATVAGDMDARGMLGIDRDVRTGFGQVSVSYEIDADASHDDIVALVAQSQKRSAVYDVVTNPTVVSVEVR